MSEYAKKLICTTIFSLIVAAAIFAGIYYYFDIRSNIPEIAFPEQKSSISSKDQITSLIKNYYNDYISAVNTNVGWPELIKKYTREQASDIDLSNAVALSIDASNYSQHLAEFKTPIQIRFLSVDNEHSEVAVDGTITEAIAGNKPTDETFRKLLIMNKIDGNWYIVGNYDRTERFDENIFKNQ